MTSSRPVSRALGFRLGRFAPAASLALALVACSPRTPTPELGASPETREAFAEAGFADPDREAARVGGALDLLHGTPAHPGYHLLGDWEEDEFDPSDAWWELSLEASTSVIRDNRRRFSAQLAAVEAAKAGSPLAVPQPLGSDAPWELWQDRFGPLIEGEAQIGDLHPDSPSEEDADEYDPAFTWGEDAAGFWERYYPSLAESAELYRVRCAYCHGNSGAGDGPTGRYLDPPPRDFRDGIFKWVDVEAGRRPGRYDLLHVLQRGVRGTAMPSFRRLTRGELEGLVDWVRFLAVRGETEKLSVFMATQAGAMEPESATRAYAKVWDRWLEAADHAAEVPIDVPWPEDVTASMLDRGAELFRGELANCASCHGNGGLGDGDAIWETGEDGERTRRKDHWGNPSEPRNLTAGIFRGGDRPADLYRRIKYGIGGTIMPAADATLTEADIWSLVYFVFSLSDASLGSRTSADSGQPGSNVVEGEGEE